MSFNWIAGDRQSVYRAGTEAHHRRHERCPSPLWNYEIMKLWNYEIIQLFNYATLHATHNIMILSIIVTNITAVMTVHVQFDKTCKDFLYYQYY